MNKITNLNRIVEALRKAGDPYEMGFDCGLNGANTINCSFGLFSTPEKTKEWERGKKVGLSARAKKSNVLVRKPKG